MDSWKSWEFFMIFEYSMFNAIIDRSVKIARTFITTITNNQIIIYSTFVVSVIFLDFLVVAVS